MSYYSPYQKEDGTWGVKSKIHADHIDQHDEDYFGYKTNNIKVLNEAGARYLSNVLNDAYWQGQQEKTKHEINERLLPSF